MKDRTALLVSALVFASCTLGAASLARTSSTVGQVLAAGIVAGGVLATASLTPTRIFPRWALVGAGAIFAACLAMPLAFVADPGAWLRENPALLGYFWLWMTMVGLPSSRGRGWCSSPRVLLIAAAILGGGAVTAALW